MPSVSRLLGRYMTEKLLSRPFDLTHYALCRDFVYPQIRGRHLPSDVRFGLHICHARRMKMVTGNSIRVGKEHLVQYLHR